MTALDWLRGRREARTSDSAAPTPVTPQPLSQGPPYTTYRPGPFRTQALDRCGCLGRYSECRCGQR